MDFKRVASLLPSTVVLVGSYLPNINQASEIVTDTIQSELVKRTSKVGVFGLNYLLPLNL